LEDARRRVGPQLERAARGCDRKPAFTANKRVATSLAYPEGHAFSARDRAARQAACHARKGVPFSICFATLSRASPSSPSANNIRVSRRSSRIMSCLSLWRGPSALDEAPTEGTNRASTLFARWKAELRMRKQPSTRKHRACKRWRWVPSLAWHVDAGIKPRVKAL